MPKARYVLKEQQTQVEPKTVVIVAMVGSMLVVTFKDVTTNGAFPPVTTWVAMGALFIGIGIASDLVPAVGVPFALLVFFSILFSGGREAIEGVENYINQTTKKTKGLTDKTKGKGKDKHK